MDLLCARHSHDSGHRSMAPKRVVDSPSIARTQACARESDGLPLTDLADLTLHPEVNLQTGCGFFKLPAELRNVIYDLVFDTHKQSELPLEHAESCAPSKLPLTACRRVYSEAKGIFDTSIRGYWSQTTFTIEILESKKRITATELSVAAIQLHIRHIQHIGVTTSTKGIPLTIFLLGSTREARSWSLTTDPKSRVLRQSPPLVALDTQILVGRMDVRGGAQKYRQVQRLVWTKQKYGRSAYEHLRSIWRSRSLTNAEWGFLRTFKGWIMEQIGRLEQKARDDDLKRSDLAAILVACYEAV